LVSFFAILAQSLRYYPIKLSGCFRCDTCKWWRLFLGYTYYNIGCGLPFERSTACHHLVDHNSQTPDITSRIYLFATRLFGRHVMRGTHDHAGVRLDQNPRRGFGIRRRTVGSSLCEFCQTKIEYLHKTIATDHDVVGLNIAMNYAGSMGLLERAGDLDRNIKDLPDFKMSRSHLAT